MPLLHEVAEKWTALAAEEDFAATAFRPSSNLPVDSDRARQKIATVRSFSAMNGTDIERAHWLDPILAGATSSFSFRHDGKVLARFHDRLFYLDFVDGAPFPVGVPSKRIALVGESRWMVPAPMGGFALIGPTHLLMLRQGLFTAMATPDRPGGGDVGAICSVMGDGGVFGLVTTPVPGVTEHPELWTSFDAIQWSRPQPLPMDGTVNSIAYGPFGYIAVGASPQENGRAIFMGFDGRVHSYEKGVVERPPLLVATCGTHTTAWTAGEGFILRLDREGVAAEPLEVHETPVAMKLDLVGIPWLLTTHTVLRRHLEGGKPVWRVYHRVETNLPAQTAFGFNTRGVCVFDRYGDGVLITPFDIEDWSEVETWSRESSRG